MSAPSFELRPLQIPADIPTIHDWVRRDYARFWGMQGLDEAGVRAGYEAILEPPDVTVFLAHHAGEPAFLVECYEPARGPLARHYDAQPGDRGMHILVAPPPDSGQRISGFTHAAFRTVIEHLFADPQATRIVVEPDVRNTKIRALNRAFGFREVASLELAATTTTPAKTAMLSFCTREDFARALLAQERSFMTKTPSHLESSTWDHVTRAQIAKMIGEFAHERLIRPRLVDEREHESDYLLELDGDVAYRFRARLWGLEHWQVDPGSIVRLHAGLPTPLDALELILDLRPRLEIDDAALPGYLEELGASLYAAVYKHEHERYDAAVLARASFQDIETSMTAGHPCFVVNAGRLGFDITDYRRYAPEVGEPFRVVWLAARRTRAHFSAITGLDHAQLLDRELDRETLARFEQVLTGRGLDPADYLLLPVHPWQWENHLCTTFVADIARDDLVLLGLGDDLYQPQQSIRTLFNRSRPERCYVKSALSILNMGFVRGLSPYYMEGTPAINEWVDELITSDETLRRCGFGILRELAAVGYRSPTFVRAAPRTHACNKMLATLWRDSPWTRVDEHQRLLTMASLLHVDRSGRALLPELIAVSGATPEQWLRRYLEVYLTPLLHCFYAHELVFMPHGENVILVLDGGLPARILMKDIAEEVAVFHAPERLPERVRRIAIEVPEHVRLLSIFVDVFDCFFRFLAPIADRDCGLPQRRFWQLVAEVAREHQRAHPQLAGEFARFDLFAPHFELSCLNRMQLRNTRQLLDLTDPTASLQFQGAIENPLAVFAAREVEA